jgi:hypothetical protein
MKPPPIALSRFCSRVYNFTSYYNALQEKLMILYIIAAIVVGWLSGIFINALSDSMPFLRRPRLPLYPDGTTRPLVAWSGLIAFLTGHRQGSTPTAPLTDEETGEVTYVPNRLKWRHIIVELGTPLLFAWLVLRFADDRPLLRFVIWFIYLTILILITVIDIEHFLILFPISIPSIIIAAALSMLSPPEGHAWEEFLLGGLAGFGVFFLIFAGGVLFNILTGNSVVAFGFGDVMLATIAGFMVGIESIFAVTIWAILFGGVGAVAYVVVSLVLRNFTAMKPLPYGPYIALATALSLISS